MTWEKVHVNSGSNWSLLDGRQRYRPENRGIDDPDFRLSTGAWGACKGFICKGRIWYGTTHIFALSRYLTKRKSGTSCLNLTILL